jgi:hypothetical protein
MPVKRPGGATPVVVAAGALLIAVSAGVGCKSAEECREDDDCPATNACVASVCVARVGPNGYTASVELEPAQESANARRDYPTVSFTADPATLQLDRRISLHARLVPSLADQTDRHSSVEVVLSATSPLAGRPDVTLEGGGISRAPSFLYETQLGVPEALLGRPARLRVLPDMPIDQVLCPWQLDITVEPEMTVPLPGEADTIRVEGKVVAAATDAMMPAYQARLFAGTRMVSNVARTDATGKFALRAQEQVLRGREDARIEITQADLANASTTLVLIFAGATSNLGELKLPPIPAPIAFVVPVYEAQGQGTELKAPVVGASVRFFTRVGGASAGELHYVRTGQTGPEGTATIPLLPGSGSDTRDYVVSVVPPATSASGSLCVPTYSIGAPVANNRVTAAIFLPLKAVLTGQIRRFDDRPAPRMNVRATRIDASFPPACGTTLASPPTEGMANGEGVYRLQLDPGDYLIEVDPPTGGGLPRITLPLVTVAGPATVRDIDLPEGLLIEGKVVAPDGTPVAQTRVRVFPNGSTTSPPGNLLGSALTGPEGQFRLVLPRLP